ncbi:hypothetical protein F751_6491 [Auxenochlorella protothecoides]|uniref:Uncharacterized protein n=1 Tax=Auxenochlorella protothecoides TaxID=3075 RepID=A0A087STB8_AUXPR|nr:hypothetical protein F751_6491 [Auxenochlorella protothecoides]KFM28972.1 hypothetical protein F751_6491 [Auxenochlorella protothecoides]
MTPSSCCSLHPLVLSRSGLPARGGQVLAVGVVLRAGQANGRSQDMVRDAKGVHQGHRHTAQLAAQRLHHALDGLGLLRGQVVVVTEQDVGVDARQRKQVRQRLEAAAAVGVVAALHARVHGLQRHALDVRPGQVLGSCEGGYGCRVGTAGSPRTVPRELSCAPLQPPVPTLPMITPRPPSRQPPHQEVEQAPVPGLEGAVAARVLAQTRGHGVQHARSAVAQRGDEEARVAQVAWRGVVREQRVGGQRVAQRSAQVGPGGGERGAAEGVAVLLEQQASHLLQQDGVVALKGLKDVVVGAQGAQTVDGRVAVPAAALAAHRQRGGGEPGGVGLEPRAERVHVGRQRLVARALHLHVLVHQRVLGEGQRVGGGQRGQQAQLLGGVVQYRHLRRCAPGAKLLALRGVADGDGQPALEHAQAAGGETHAPTGQLPQRGRKALGRGGHGRGVPPRAVHAGEAVQQCAARHAYMREPDGAVVHAVEAHLVAAILNVHARSQAPRRGAQRHHKGVHAVVVQLAAAGGRRDLEAREDRGGQTVLRRVPDPPLERAVVGGMDDPLVGLDVQHCLGLQRRHVRAVAQLGHGEAAGEVEAVDGVEVAAAVLLRAQVQHAAAPQAVLHPHLHRQAQVHQGHELAQVEVAPGVGGQQRQWALPRRQQRAQAAPHQLPVLLLGQGLQLLHQQLRVLPEHGVHLLLQQVGGVHVTLHQRGVEPGELAVRPRGGGKGGHRIILGWVRREVASQNVLTTGHGGVSWTSRPECLQSGR